MIDRIGRYLADNPSALHLIVAAFPAIFVASAIIGLSLWLFPGYSLIRETANQYTVLFAIAVAIGVVTSVCSLLWAGRKTWEETAYLFPPDYDDPKDR